MDHQTPLIGATFCSGIGAPECAAPWIDWRFASEIEPFPRAVLQARFGYKTPEDQNQGEPLLWGDMTEISPDLWRKNGIPLPDILVAGTPCQAFSIAGLRKGLKDKRGNLTMKFVEICHAIVDARPDGKLRVLWENVPGVLSDKENAFGNFLAGLVGADHAFPRPNGKSWPVAGMVVGPRARAAWRVFDAQYFGVAQRRRRVFVVVDFGDAIDPAKVLFEPKGMHGNFAPRRQAGQDPAGTIEASFDRRRGSGMNPSQLAACESGASHWSGGPHPSPNQASKKSGGIGASNQEIFSQQGAGIVAGPLTAGMHKGPRGTEAAEGNHIIPAVWPAEITATSNAAFGDKMGLEDQHALGGASLFVPSVLDQVTPYDTTQITSAQNGSNPKYGDPCHPLAAAAHPPAIAFSAKDFGGDAMADLSPTLRVGGAGNAGGPVMPAICFNPDKMPSNHTPPKTKVVANTAVRRLMPVECARLQGFPDDHTEITYRGKPASDGPQYKAYGNSMAVPNIAWILERMR